LSSSVVVVVVREKGCGLQLWGLFPVGAMYNMLCAEIMWMVGIVGERVVGLGSRKLRV